MRPARALHMLGKLPLRTDTNLSLLFETVCHQAAQTSLEFLILLSQPVVAGLDVCAATSGFTHFRITSKVSKPLDLRSMKLHGRIRTVLFDSGKLNVDCSGNAFPPIHKKKKMLENKDQVGKGSPKGHFPKLHAGKLHEKKTAETWKLLVEQE